MLCLLILRIGSGSIHIRLLCESPLGAGSILGVLRVWLLAVRRLGLVLLVAVAGSILWLIVCHDPTP